FFYLASFNSYIIKPQFFFFLQFIKVETERSYIRCKLFCFFFKCYKHSGLIKFGGTIYKEFNRKKGLTAHRPATDKSRSALWNSSHGYFIEATDPCFSFTQ